MFELIGFLMPVCLHLTIFYIFINIIKSMEM
jgi:hypothetical protein